MVFVIDALQNRFKEVEGISVYLLLVITIKDTGVLSAPVIALLVECRWIVEHEEMTNKLLVGFLITIKFAIVHLDVSRCARANFSVRGVGS